MIHSRYLPEERAIDPRSVLKDGNLLQRNRKFKLGPEKRGLLMKQMEKDVAVRE